MIESISERQRGLLSFQCVYQAIVCVFVVVQKAGRKLLSGDFNLTRISFPIRCMSKNSAISVMAQNISSYPFYMGRAADLCDQPIERMKMVVGAEISSIMYNHSFEKPLNPILGETYEARGQDGAGIYFEQISHHPPISAYLIEHEKYRTYGHVEWSIKAGLQSAEVEYLGNRKITFKQGGSITYNYPKDKVYGLFMGPFGYQVFGEQTFTDKEHDIEAKITHNGYFFKKQDYFWGELKQNGKVICEISGSYVGHLDFGGVRYWDHREQAMVHRPIVMVNDPPASDASMRTDSIFLQTKPVDEAQIEKERLEDIQRNDRKLREQCEQRRQNGGPKFAASSE